MNAKKAYDDNCLRFTVRHLPVETTSLQLEALILLESSKGNKLYRIILNKRKLMVTFQSKEENSERLLCPTR